MQPQATVDERVSNRERLKRNLAHMMNWRASMALRTWREWTAARLERHGKAARALHSWSHALLLRALASFREGACILRTKRMLLERVSRHWAGHKMHCAFMAWQEFLQVLSVAHSQLPCSSRNELMVGWMDGWMK